MTKVYNARNQQKHDIESNWTKAINFVPYAGEIIIYDPDETYFWTRMKIGNGGTAVNDLPFINQDQSEHILELISQIDNLYTELENITQKQNNLNESLQTSYSQLTSNINELSNEISQILIKNNEQDVKIQENTSRLNKLSTFQASSVLTNIKKYSFNDNGAQLGGVIIQGDGNSENPTTKISSQEISTPNMLTNQLTINNFLFQKSEDGSMGCYSI